MRRPQHNDGDKGVAPMAVGIMTLLWRWRSKAQDDDGHIMSHILIACDVYLLCILFCLGGGRIIRSSLTKFQGISVLPEYAPLRQFFVPRHHVMIGCDKLYVQYNGCKPVLHTQNTRVKLDEPSICRYGLGTLRPKGRA